MRFSRLSAGVWAAIAFCVLFSLHHVTAVFTESINWDEWGLFRRVQNAVALNRFEPAGRPGLGNVVLMPLVDGCTDPVEVARIARLAWVVFSLGYPLALWVMLRRFLSDVRGTHHRAGWDAFAAVSLLVLVPLWLRWSLQVRTDQPALFFVIVAGYLMLLARRRLALAAAAGLVAMVGYLFTQKAAYAGLIIAPLVLVHARATLEPWRKFFLRTTVFLVPFVVLYVAFTWFTDHAFVRPPRFSMDEAFSHLHHYEQALQRRLYPFLAPYMIPHFFLAAGLVATSIRDVWLRRRLRAELCAAWLVLMTSLAVVAFHTTTLGYFWMTLGLFPAVALALSLGALRQWLQEANAPHLILRAVSWLAMGWLIFQCIPTARSVLEDTQSPQQEAFEFINQNFPRSEIGYHPEGGLFCREADSNFEVTFSLHIRSRFYGPRGRDHLASFLEKFRSIPVSFILASHRLSEFPAPAQAFWQDNYAFRAPLVLVPAKPIVAGTNRREVIVPGNYRWQPRAFAPLRINGVEVPPNGLVHLDRGVHAFRTESTGLLVRHVQGQSGAPGHFYSLGSLIEIAPHPAHRPGWGWEEYLPKRVAAQMERH